MPDAAGYVQLPWPRIRELVTDTLTIGHKSLAEINHEIRQASLSDLYHDAGVRRRRRIVRLPRVLRALLWWWTLRDPARIKQNCGTVGVSNVGAFAGPRPAWVFGPAFLTTT